MIIKLAIIFFMTALSIQQVSPPVVGILTADISSTDYPPNSTHIFSSYTKWLEQNKIRWIPLFLFEDKASFLSKLDLVDGVLLPGGDDVMGTKENPSHYLKTVNTIIHYAKERNDNGDNFPIYGTCLGFESILTSLSNFDIALEHTPDENFSLAVTFTYGAEKSLIGSVFSKEDLDGLRDQEVFYFHHHDGFHIDELNNNRYFNKNIWAIGVSQNREGLKFLSIYQHRKYPFFGTQFHTEKIQFTYRDDYPLNRSAFSFKVNSGFSKIFRNMLGFNKSGLTNKEVLEFRKGMIVVFGFKNEDEVYIFKGKEERLTTEVE